MKGASTRRPDDFMYARMGRLLILLDSVPTKPKPKPLNSERLSIYDFFADNPMLVFGPESIERRSLLVSGFGSTSLSYNSSGQRFANRVRRLQHDLAALVTRGLVQGDHSQARVSFGLTDHGSEAAGSFRSMYALGYRKSSKLVIGELNRLSDTALRERAQRMLHADGFLLDLQIASIETAVI